MSKTTAPLAMKGKRLAAPNSQRNRVSESRGKANSRAVPTDDMRFSGAPGNNYSGRAYRTSDDTNHSKDHVGSGADYHAFGAPAGDAQIFKTRPWR